MIEMIKRYKREVIIGVVVSLITTFIIKAWDWLIYNVPSTGKSVIAYCENIIYTYAAEQSNNSLGILFSVLVFGSGIGVFLSIIRSMLSDYIKDRKLKKRTDGLSDEAKKTIDSKGGPKLIDKNESPSTDKIKEIKKYRMAIVELIISVIILYVFVFGFILRPARLWSNFERDITLIYPYVEENQIYRLKSDWVRMKSKDDYNKIYEYINYVKEEFSLSN